MLSARLRNFCVVLSATSLLLASTGCSSRPVAAQKLFDKGEYQKVIDKYPDLEISRRARAKLADNLFQQKQYTTVLSQYGDTPAAYKSRMALAQAMFDAGRYQALIDSFPQSPLVPTAKEKLSDSLYAAGQLDRLVMLYPDTPKAKMVKEQRGSEALALAKKKRGDEKKKALEEILKFYPNTEAFKEANEMLNTIRAAEAAKANSRKK